MPLITLWTSNPATVAEFSIEQVVATAGDGVLKDNSACSAEFREYLAQIPSPKIATYIEHCLAAQFTKGGMVLQDLVNELGRRLDYQVTNGRYQGTVNAIGFDGVWTSPEGHTIIAEVKTTDAYRISLETIAVYRDKLLQTAQIRLPASILIVVGREDTGELEAQVRGSRHAWDIRLISADALVKLVQLKENADGPETGRKIRSLLKPMEYTRLDPMIDVMFTTAKDVDQAKQIGQPEEDEETQEGADQDSGAKGVWQFTDSMLLQQKRDIVIAAVGRLAGVSLIRKSASLHWDSLHETRVACTISKRYTKKGAYPYWYAYHPRWDEFLAEGKTAYFVLGCMDLNVAFAIPRRVLHPVLDALNTTTKPGAEPYWHIHLVETPNGLSLLLPKKSSSLALAAFKVALTT